MPVTAQQYHALYVRRWRERIAGRQPPRHGTLTGYTNYSCRCPDCTAAKREHLRSWRAWRSSGQREAETCLAPP